MTVAAYKDLCIDAVDPQRTAAFWGAVIGRTAEDAPSGAVLRGPTPEHTVWINGVPEEKVVKHRVHLDVYAEALADLERLGAQVVDTAAGGGWWTVMADPEGGEFCAFLREPLPAELLHGLVVDCADAAAIATWWGGVYGAEVVHHPNGYSTVQGVPGMPIATFDFVPVPEGKTAKNRVHWDVAVGDTVDLVDAGATLLRPRGGGIDWDVLADPDGNEFCAFAGRGAPA
jgi:predicted enzyme related to lactoylglutathione lyase